MTDNWTPSPNARTDFPKVLEDLAALLGEPVPNGNPDFRVPCSERVLAEQLKVARMTLKGWIEGSEPRHSDGERLIELWCRLTGKARTFLPVDRFVFSAAKAGVPMRRTTDKPRAALGLESVRCLA